MGKEPSKKSWYQRCYLTSRRRSRKSNEDQTRRQGLGRNERVDKRKLEVKFSEIMEKVLKHEGGYVNDPDDPGGETKYGIAKRSHPEVDIKNLTLDGALDIYKRLYWTPSKADKLVPELRLCYFDGVVNMGQGRMVRVLQKACNNKNGRGKKIAVDGRIGRMTLKASENLEHERLKAFRLLYYADLIRKNPVLEKYYFGWCRRVMF